MMMRLTIVTAFLVVSPLAFGSWQNFVSNPSLEFQKDGLKKAPADYKVDLGQGRVDGPGYYLRLQKTDVAAFNVVNEIEIRKVPALTARVKQADKFSLRRFQIENGKAVLFTECEGDRMISDFMGMVASLKEASLGNSRIARCSTVSPKLCSTLREELAAFGKQHEMERFATACQKYAEDLSKVFLKVASQVSKDVISDETSAAKEVLKEVLKGSSVFDISTVNVTTLLQDVSAEKRVADLRSGMVMFNELVALQGACGNLDDGAEKVNKKPVRATDKQAQ